MAKSASQLVRCSVAIAPAYEKAADAALVCATLH
jgi:hypothetical protein